MRELSTRDNAANTYVSRMVYLTTLASDIDTVILDDKLHSNVTLLKLAADPPALWEEQRKKLSELSI